MKTSLIFVIGFAVFAVAAARVSPKEAEDEEDDEQQEYQELTFEDILIGAAEWSQDNDPEYQKAVSTSSQPTAEQESINGVPSPIPSPNSLALKSDPIELGKEIAKLDENKRDEYIERMKELIDESPDTVQADFYEAAIKAIDSPEKASQEWKKTVEKANNYGEQMAEEFPEIDNLFDDNTRLTTVNSILKADPLDAAEASGIPIMLHIGTGSSGSLVVASSFNTISSSDGKVKGNIQRLILDRIEERGGVDEFYKKHFSSPAPNSQQ